MDDRRPTAPPWRARRPVVGRLDRWGFALVVVAALASLTVVRAVTPPDLQWLASLPNTVDLTTFVGHPIRRLKEVAAPLFATNSDQRPCSPDEATFALGMADLKTRIGEAMGDPLECEHPIDIDGDTVQLTTTGLASYTQRTQTLTFTDGAHAWTLSGDILSVWDLDRR